jgi:hypothetical protein
MPGLSEAERARLLAWAERWGLTPPGVLRAGADSRGLQRNRALPPSDPAEQDRGMLLGALLTVLLALALLFGSAVRGEPRHGYGIADPSPQGPYASGDPRQGRPADP